MPAYLYQARVSGIQAYITATGKLKEIVGGSELIERVCTVWFESAVGPSFEEARRSLGAAGKIEYLFPEDEARTYQEVVRRFPKFVAEHAPGLQLAQAIVRCEGEGPTIPNVQEVERMLNAQEAQMAASHLPGLMITRRSSRTGGPVERIIPPLPEGETRDPTQHRKIKAIEVEEEGSIHKHGSLFQKLLGDEGIAPYHKTPLGNNAFPLEMEELTGNEERAWIAVVHADGNSMGQRIDYALEYVAGQSPGKLIQFRKALSGALMEASYSAVRQAFEQTVGKTHRQEVAFQLSESGTRNPVFLGLRPIVLGGDDVTAVIRGDLALAFTGVLLKSFEAYTRKTLGQLSILYDLPLDVYPSEANQAETNKEKLPIPLAKGVSICAGITYIKSNYPFHYGLRLAEDLCKEAKNVAKKLARARNESILDPSCLAFHKVHSSFVEAYRRIAKRELTAGSLKEPIYLDAGPYFIDPQPDYHQIDDLIKWVDIINKPSAPKSNLREWLAQLTGNESKAHQRVERIREVSSRYESTLDLGQHDVLRPASEIQVKARKDEDKFNCRVTHLHDVLSLASIHAND